MTAIAATISVLAGGAALRATGAAAPLRPRRFASTFKVDAGTLTPGVAMMLSIPPDMTPGNWYAATPATQLTVCTL